MEDHNERESACHFQTSLSQSTYSYSDIHKPVLKLKLKLRALRLKLALYLVKRRENYDTQELIVSRTSVWICH